MRGSTFLSMMTYALAILLGTAIGYCWEHDRIRAHERDAQRAMVECAKTAADHWTIWHGNSDEAAAVAESWRQLEMAARRRLNGGE